MFVLLSRSSMCKEFEFLCPFSKAAEKYFITRFLRSCFAFDQLYIDLKTKTLVLNDQQCFALTLCVQLPLNSKANSNQNSNVDNFLADLQSLFQIHICSMYKKEYRLT